MSRLAKQSAKTDGTHVFLVVWRTFRALLAASDASKRRLGLGDSDFRVLEVLLNKGPLPVNIIGGKVDLSTGSITTAIDRLEIKSLVRRNNHQSDGRIRMVDLTLKGRRLIEKAYAHHQVDMEDAAGALSREERIVLIDLLKRLGGANRSLDSEQSP